MSLRARLLVGLVVLAAAGLTVAAVVTYEEQRSFLLTRTDQQVADSRFPVAVALGVVRRPAGVRGPTPSGRRAVVPPTGRGGATSQTSGTYGELLSSKGKVIARRAFTYGETAAPPPDIRPGFPVSSLRGRSATEFTVGAQTGSGLRYRAAAFSIPGGRVMIVAVPMRDVDQTLQRLVLVELLVGLGVILGLIVLGWAVIAIGLRPLERMGRVASEIAGGDLSRRVSPDNQRTEVGRLGASLNGMLSQIERAFADRSQSEGRLRRFLADASHELRTPLAAIRGYAELFRLGAADDPVALARAMERIESETARMGTLVEDMLLLASLDELPEPTRERTDLVELVTQAADDTRAIAPERKVSVAGPDALPVLAAPDQIRQVLANLTRNAVVHTPPGTAIELSAARSNGDAILEVRDRGPGLPAGAGEEIFDRFWRAEGGRRRGAAGAGLGLAIVRAIVHGHHGKVQALNAEDGGAIFRVILPVEGAGTNGYAPDHEPAPEPEDRRA